MSNKPIDMNANGILKGHKVVVVDDVIEWAKQFEGMDRRVAKTILPDGKMVSTVFLGLNYQFFPEHKPQWFETMVFPKDGDFGDLDMERYETWEEAEEGHKQMVLKWTNKGKTND